MDISGNNTASSRVIQSGIKEVVNSYTGSGTLVNGGASKVVPAVVGATKAVKTAPKTLHLVGKVPNISAVFKVGVKGTTKAAIKGASKALGPISFIPDAVTFGVGAYKGIKNEIENPKPNPKPTNEKKAPSWITIL